MPGVSPVTTLCAKHKLADSKNTNAESFRYALSAATAIMFWMVVKKPLPDSIRRVRQNKEW